MNNALLRRSSQFRVGHSNSSGSSTDQNGRSTPPSPSVSSLSSADDLSGDPSNGSLYAYASAYLSSGLSHLNFRQDDNNHWHANSAAILFIAGILYIILAADVGLCGPQSSSPAVSLAGAEPPSSTVRKFHGGDLDGSDGDPSPPSDGRNLSGSYETILLCLVQNIGRLYKHSIVSSDDAPVPLLSLPQYPDLQFDKAKIHALLASWGIKSSIDANSWTLGRTVCSILRSDDRIRSVVAMLDKEDGHTFFTTLDNITSADPAKSRVPLKPTPVSSASGPDESGRTGLRIVTTASSIGETSTKIYDSPVQFEFPSSDSACTSPTYSPAPSLLKAPVLPAHHRVKAEMRHINPRPPSKSLFLPGSASTSHTLVGTQTSLRARATSLIALTRGFSLPPSPAASHHPDFQRSLEGVAIRRRFETLQKSPPAQQALTFTNAQGLWAAPTVKYNPLQDSHTVWSVFSVSLSKGKELQASGVAPSHILRRVPTTKAPSSDCDPLKLPDQPRGLSTVSAKTLASVSGPGPIENNHLAEVIPPGPQKNSASGNKAMLSDPDRQVMLTSILTSSRAQAPKRSSTSPSLPRITISSPSSPPLTPLKSRERVRAGTFPVARSPNVAGGGAFPRLHPSLAEVERSSKLLKSSIQCAVCGEYGKDYPRCARCHEAWCSRACRIKALQGAKRHPCKVAVIPTEILNRISPA
ncbi:hypothetical protein BS47DRAFT_1483983 [Hydnum rufescens UP504]|uniref:Uncharacterized protein n=1 Tax=Hydnum rufescens UP504 TaxID=1448309 RepID=A0A9P6DVK4_9AGAM|nr:hypothetical protein BS47DRAFT_1483983 [Hydnum rufescens UP504]